MHLLTILKALKGFALFMFVFSIFLEASLRIMHDANPLTTAGYYPQLMRNVLTMQLFSSAFLCFFMGMVFLDEL